MTGGGPNNASTTLVIYAYSLCFAGSSSAGYAMAVSNILFVVILVIAMLQRGMMKRRSIRDIGKGKYRIEKSN